MRWIRVTASDAQQAVFEVDGDAVTVTCDEDFLLRIEVLFPWGDAFAPTVSYVVLFTPLLVALA